MTHADIIDLDFLMDSSTHRVTKNHSSTKIGLGGSVMGNNHML